MPIKITNPKVDSVPNKLICGSGPKEEKTILIALE
jgi:hypothetical protein